VDTSPGLGPPEDESGADGTGDPGPDGGEPDQPTAEGAEAEQPSPDGAEPGSPNDQDDPTEGKDPLRFNRWMKRSSTGAIMTGISLGLREALQPAVKEPAFMIEASGQPEDPDNPIELHFDPDNPADTVAIIRQPSPDGHHGSPPPAE
jgi:hypothetical protein